ncbi:hypothetical protein B0T11DRAFT_287036 [Plectosphaerella cucumerina]|uniref:Uncharacterized protein n=1 Tax=Plectosphaerella cucumerina TaxID=40658 RepID=A0A8K0T7N1_9PEZI|nr:hypothetical protein B0T11DRAFT_287036 [Plectosphaerella cucumerina]
MWDVVWTDPAKESRKEHRERKVTEREHHRQEEERRQKQHRDEFHHGDICDCSQITTYPQGRSPSSLDVATSKLAEVTIRPLRQWTTSSSERSSEYSRESVYWPQGINRESKVPKGSFNDLLIDNPVPDAEGRPGREPRESRESIASSFLGRSDSTQIQRSAVLQTFFFNQYLGPGSNITRWVQISVTTVPLETSIHCIGSTVLISANGPG